MPQNFLISGFLRRIQRRQRFHPSLCGTLFRTFRKKQTFSQMNCPYDTTRNCPNQHFFAIFTPQTATPSFCTNCFIVQLPILFILYSTPYKSLNHRILPFFFREKFRFLLRMQWFPFCKFPCINHPIRFYPCIFLSHLCIFASLYF